MLVLLPPSESKATGGLGSALELDALSFPVLTRTRRALVSALVRAARQTPGQLRTALGLSDRQQAEVAADAALRTAATMPAIERYTGVIYDELDYASLTASARRRADAGLVVASALFGLLRPRDLIPHYRLSAATALPGQPGLATRWRPVLEPLLAESDGLVVDLRSGAYAGLARVPGAVEVRVLRDVDGRRTVVSHDNKYTKGRLARALIVTAARTLDDVAQAGLSVADAVEVDGRRVDLLLHGLASAR